MLVPLMNATFMPPLTRHTRIETTRNTGAQTSATAIYDRPTSLPFPANGGHRPPLQEQKLSRSNSRGGLSLLFALLALAFTGCATGGSNHVYATTQAGTAIHDLGPDGHHATLPRTLNLWERVLGLAYDYNTDHLFLRLWPRQIIRVIERPSGKILREMRLPAALHTAAPADLAVRSTDRHLFAVDATGRAVAELTLFGEPVGRIDFPAVPQPITGLAFDQRTGHLLLLTGNTVHVATTEGRLERAITLSAPVRSVSLAYDSDTGYFFVPLKDGHTLGEFDATGTLRQSHPVAGRAEITALDAGPRSLVRVF